MYDTVSIEDLDRPTITLVNEGFAIDGRSAASNKGMPGLRIVPEPVPCECSIMEDAEAGVGHVMDRVIEGLTVPLTPDEESPKAKEKETPSRIVFKGNIEEVNRFLYRRGWGDGLPIIPPTEESVKMMLTGTDLPADHLLGKVPPRLGKATIEKIAVNAVMAGALPVHMPILIACVEAILDPTSCFDTWNMSTGSWAPFWIVNGPIRHDVHVNFSSGAFSPGDIANAAIGRAMGLIIKNIGGIRKGIEDMGVLGNPGKYTMVIAENEEESPWEAFHVTEGFEKSDSTVTLFFPNCYTQIWPYGSDDRGILNAVIYNVLPGRGGLTCCIFTPAHAKTLAKNGWTKEMIKKYISDFARVPAYRHPYYYETNKALAKPGTVPMNSMDPMAVIPNPQFIKILIAGGPGAFIGIAAGASLGDTKWASKKIKLPVNWNKLIAKYKNVAPKYEKY
ncbi:MAG: hypothetical protein JXD19_12810 [Deltaproteobacteria bacterium]|nr:hypothetical protein [Deltaproteobacteria bacterium]